MNSPGMNHDRPGIDRDELLHRVPLEDVLERLSGPAVAGRWRCPDAGHPDEHPSVTVTVRPDRIQRWRCWSGGHGGTAIDAVTAATGVGFAEALGWLADHYGTWPPAQPCPSTPPVGAPSRSVIQYVQRAERLLWTPAGQPQRDWLAARGLGDDVLRVNRVGADPGRRHLPRPRGFPPGWPAVVLPALSPGGTIAYFQARYLDRPAGRGKYDNPAARHATNPGVAWLHPAGPMRPGVLVVTEGITDGLVATQAGFATVGALGAQHPGRRVADTIATTIHHSPRLADVTVVICFDADDAGHRGQARLAAALSERGIPHRAATPPHGLDLTDWAQTQPHWHRDLAAPRHPPPTSQAPAELRTVLRIPGPGPSG
jgi:DNA primase